MFDDMLVRSSGGSAGYVFSLWRRKIYGTFILHIRMLILVGYDGTGTIHMHATTVESPPRTLILIVN